MKRRMTGHRIQRDLLRVIHAHPGLSAKELAKRIGCSDIAVYKYATLAEEACEIESRLALGPGFHGPPPRTYYPFAFKDGAGSSAKTSRPLDSTHQDSGRSVYATG